MSQNSLIHRIAIFGRPGSGKSTFATKLSQKLDIPVHHLDRHFFVENWVARDYEEFLAIQQDFVDQEAWIIDGNNVRSLEMRYARATMVIYFHLPIIICLWRMCKRLFHKNWHIPDLAEGCTKIIRFKLLTYMFRFHRRYGPKIETLRKKYPDVQFYCIRHDGQLAQF